MNFEWKMKEIRGKLIKQIVEISRYKSGNKRAEGRAKKSCLKSLAKER